MSASGSEPAALAEDLFRRESARLVAALTRLLGPAHLPLVEDVVQDALLSALTAWRAGPPKDPSAWLLTTAKNRALDALRRSRRLGGWPPDAESLVPDEQTLEGRLSEAAIEESQLAFMFSLCHDELSSDTHVTLILRFLCGLGPREISSAFLADVQTIDRRLHRGRERLRELGQLHNVSSGADVAARLPSVLRALYLLFSEGYHGSKADAPTRISLCAEAIWLNQLLLGQPAAATPEAHALAALFAFNAARLSTRMDDEGIFIPLAEQDRSRWDPSLLAAGVRHLSASAEGKSFSRWHLEAGIACEHALAPSVEETNWARIVALYDALGEVTPGPVVLLNRALAIAELHGPEAGEAALAAIADDPRLVAYPFYWAAVADLARRSGNLAEARRCYERAALVSRSRAERVAYERRRAQVSRGE